MRTFFIIMVILLACTASAFINKLLYDQWLDYEITEHNKANNRMRGTVLEMVKPEALK